MQAALGTEAPADEPEIVEIPPIEESYQSGAPEPPSFSVPDVPAPSFGDLGAPPPSPFTEPEPMPEEPTPAAPSFNDAETIYQTPASAPFEPPPAPAPVTEWSPPPAPDASWQNREIGANTPFQPPPAGAGGENKTLALISLICGILSLICCSWFIPGIAAIVLGVVARSKAKENPAEYGGAGLALGGIITGAISLVLGIIIIILYMAGALAGVLGNLN
jgi:hypothetical protein